MKLLQDGVREGYIIPTDVTRKITMDGVTKVYQVYKIKLSCLYYNDQNDRIATWISKYKADNALEYFDISDREQYNSVIQQFIIDSNPSAIDKTKSNISMVDQREPGVVLNDGRIIDGNRRFTCLRLLSAKDEHFAWFEAVILDKDINDNQKEIKMLELMIQHGEEGKVDYGMIPIENSLAGSVFENLDNLYRFEDVDIVGSLKLRIEHSLLTPKGGSLETIKNVYSHPQGFSQCEDFLQKYPHWNLIECSSTSDAAKLVSQKNSPENAAIASMVAAQGFNLEVLASGIETDPKNYTRFIVITTKDKENVYQISGEKIATVSFAAKNEPGALLACLSAFQKNNLNMTRLESRPIHGQPWHYMFYADIVLGETETALTEALNQLKQSAENTRLHGIYAELN